MAGVVRFPVQRSFSVAAWVVVFCCGLSPAGAAATTVSLPAVMTVEPGNIFQLPIRVTTMPPVRGYFIELSYSSEFALLSASAGSLTAAWGAPISNGLSGGCIVAGQGNTPASGRGILVTLTLQVAPSAPLGLSSLVHFVEAELDDGTVPVAATDGLVAVGDLVVLGIPPLTEVLRGKAFTLPVTLEDADGVEGYLFELSYNSSVLEFLGAEAGDTAPGWGVPAVNDTELNRLIVSGIGSEPLTGDLVLVNLAFRVLWETPLYTVTWIEFVDAEANDGEVAVLVQAGYVDVVADPVPAASMLGAGIVALTLVIWGGLQMHRQRYANASAQTQGAWGEVGNVDTRGVSSKEDPYHA